MGEKDAGRIDKIQGEIIHIYDGIEEADNELPLWWLITFYGAIAFGMVYWVVYHELNSAELPLEAYASALAGRVGEGEVSPELLLAMRDDPGAVAAGADLFQQNCVVCHSAQGEGNIGPNLTDPNWLHGGSVTDIYTSIYDGQLQNGMPAWGATLGSDSVQKIAAFVLSIQNTNVEGKAAEGEVWTPDGAEGADTEADPESAVPAEDVEPVDGEAVEGAPADGEAAEGAVVEGEAAEDDTTTETEPGGDAEPEEGTAPTPDDPGTP